MPAALALLTPVFVGWERRTAEPLLPMELFRSRAVRASTVAAVVFFGVVIALLFFSPLYLQGVLGFTPLESGLGLVPMGVTVIVTANLAGRLLSRGVSARALMAAGTVTLGAGLLVFTLSRADVAGERIGPPPAERGVEDQSGQDGGGQDAVDERDAAFRAQHRIPERGAGACLSCGEDEHHRSGDRGPGDARG
ncbi:hypothetical protein AB0L06_18515 [Spirillospora sp. NPDC052269]